MARAPRRRRVVTTTTTTTTTTTVKRPKPGNRPGKGPDNGKGDGGTAGAGAETRPGSGGRPKPPAERFPYDEVKLRVHAIRCVKTTKEIDKDEISLAAIKVEGAVDSATRRQLKARATKGETLSAGKFSKGDVERFPKGRPVATFDAGGRIGEGTRCFVGALVLIEEDEGKLGKVISSVVDQIEDKATKAISEAAASATAAALAGAATGSAAGSLIPVPLLGTAIGGIVGTAVGGVLGQVKASSADDVFPPKKTYLEMERFPNEPGEIPGSRETITFKGHKGEYEVTISWAVR